MKIVFICALAGLSAPFGLATAHADDVADMDGDGDIDAQDRALLDAAAETITIEDMSAGTQLSQSSRAVTVIDLKTDRERASDLGEVLSRAHGVQVRREGGLGSQSRFSLDGLSDEQIRFFLDGIPLELAGFGLGVANVPVDLIQRVDVYRGVVPVSLGADALGGAVDLVTDPSWVDRAALSYQLGSFGTHRGALGARVRDDATGAALGLSLFGDRATNDYLVDVEIPDAQGRLHPERVRRFHDGYTAAGGVLEAGVVARGIVERALIRVHQTQYAKQLQNNTVMTVPYGEVTYGGRTRGASGDVAIATGPWRARLVAGGAASRIDFRDLGRYVYDWRGNRVRERDMPGEVELQAIDQRITERALFARAVGERTFGSQRVRLAFGATSTRRDGESFVDDGIVGRDSIEADRALDQFVTGVEHELRAFGDRLENTAFAKHYLALTAAEDPRPNGVFVTLDHTINRAGVGDSARVRIADGLIAKASYEWATRLPGVDELFGDGVLIAQSLDLEPETSHNVNLGVQLDREVGWGAIGGEVSTFARLADNLIVLLGNDRYASYQNVYAARILGIEGQAGWIAPGEWASLDANVTVQDIRNASGEGTFGAYDGDRIPNRPWLLGSLSATVRRREVLRPLDELSLFATSRYVREFYRGWESAGLREFKQVIPGQLVHGVGITYAMRGATPIVTTFEVANLSNEQVFDSFGAQRPGRAYYLKLSFEL